MTPFLKATGVDVIFPGIQRLASYASRFYHSFFADLQSFPLVSVITPCFGKVSRYLGGFFASIDNQAYPNWESLIIDDGLDPLDLEKISSYIQGDNRYRLLRTQGDKLCLSPYQARNTGLRFANGEIIAFLDIDDLWSPDRLSAAVKLHSCGYDMVIARYTVLSRTHLIRDVVPAVTTENLPFLLEILNPIPMLTVSCKRECLQGLCFEASNHEDFIYWRHLIKSFPGLSLGIVNSGESHACYRYSTQSVSGNKLMAIAWIYNIYKRSHSNSLAFARLLTWFILWPIYHMLSSRMPSKRYWSSMLDLPEPLGRQGWRFPTQI